MYDTTKIAAFKEACKQYMNDCGLPCNDELIADGKLRRYSADANQRKRDEWYVGYEGSTLRGNPYFTCVFGSWSEGTMFQYKSFDTQHELNEQEVQELRKIASDKRIEVEKNKRKEHDAAAKKAQALWDSYSDKPTTEQHNGYLNLKGISAIGIKFGISSQGQSYLVIPLRNMKGELRSLQFIFFDEETKKYQKRFLTEAETKGNFHMLGTITGQGIVFLSEGYATGESVYQATQLPVIIVFSAGNISSVVEQLLTEYPGLTIIIAGDSDERGMKEAIAVTKKFFCNAKFPIFSKEYYRDGAKDFNDLAQAAGIVEVRRQLLPDEISEDKLKVMAESFLGEKEEPCADFRVSNLPLPLQEYISALCKETNAHPIMMTASVLTMVSALAGTKIYIPEDEYFQDLYPNLWILCIAKSGQFKSTALNKGAKIIQDKQSNIFKEMREMRAGNCTDEQILIKSLENVILPTKLTAEGLLEHLSQGHQGAIYASEFGGWLQNLDKSHNNDFKAILTEFYDVPSYYRYKTKTQGDCIIERPYISICGVSTMPWVRSNLKPTDVPSGFFARFLIFVPPYQDGIPPAFPTHQKDANNASVQKFLAHIELIRSSIGDGRVFYVSKGAREIAETFQKHIYTMAKKYDERAQEILEPYLKRWGPYLLKLSMLMQLFIDHRSNEIDGAAVSAAMGILLPAMQSTASLFERELGESEHQRKCRLVFEWLCKKLKTTGKPVKRKDLIASKQLDGGSKEYDYIITTLEEEEKIAVKKIGTRVSATEYSLVEEAAKS